MTASCISWFMSRYSYFPFPIQTSPHKLMIYVNLLYVNIMYKQFIQIIYTNGNCGKYKDNLIIYKLCMLSRKFIIVVKFQTIKN